MKRKLIQFAALFALITLSGQQASAMYTMDSGDNTSASNKTKFSETDYFLDLGTGKTFQFIYDGLNDIYNRSDLQELNLFVNTRTKDTMWLDDAIVVNNALLSDGKGGYKIDPMKVKRDGNSYRVVLPVQKPATAAVAQ